jgi:hypothetical protein
MFRGGRVSSYGTGIASGLANGGRPGYVNGGEIEEYTDIVEAVRKAYPQQQGLSQADYLRIASAGLDILGAPGEGGGIRGALTAASKPLAKLGTGLATGMEARDASREESIKDISAAIMRGRSTRDRGFALTDKLKQLTENTKKKQQLSFMLSKSKEGDQAFANYIKENHPDVTDLETIASIRKSLENELEVVNNNLKVLLPKDEVTIAFLKSGQAGQFFNSLIAAEEKNQGKNRGDPTFNWNAVIESAGRKDGGIVGYAEGGLTEMISETEEVVEETPETQPQPRGSLSYQELRSRLPKEIPDDVIAIIAASDEALIEFSNIATQQDVDAFNTKYEVELVLPQA